MLLLKEALPQEDPTQSTAQTDSRTVACRTGRHHHHRGNVRHPYDSQGCDCHRHAERKAAA